MTAGTAHRLVIVDAYPYLLSGSQRVAGQLALALPALGWEASVVLPAEGVTADALRAQGVDVRVVEAPRALMTYGGQASRLQLAGSVLAAPAYWWRLRRALRGQDVVWVNDLRGMVLAMVPALLSRARVVWHLHAAQPQLTWLIPLFARWARVVVVPSAHATQGLAASAVTVLPNPVPVTGEAWTDPLDAVPLVVSVGRLYQAKGYDVLLDACALLRDEGRRFHVTVAGAVSPGHEDEAAALRRQLAELSLDDVVELVGDVTDIPALLRRATVYVQPSRAETFGLASAEAMGVGVPVVVSATGGLRDLVVDGVTGLAVTPEDPSALAAAIARLLDDAQLRHALGATGRVHVLATLTPERFATRAAAICATAIGPRPVMA